MQLVVNACDDKLGAVAVLRITGEVDIYTAPQVRERVIHLLAGGVLHIITDLRDVEFMDSTGLGALVGSLKRARLAGGSLSLVLGPGRIFNLFRITGLVNAFTVYSSVPEAITAAGAAASAG
jgi:anti-sigma B factor antagonist